MATILPFIALKPAQGWFQDLREKMDLLQNLLEPGSHRQINHSGLQKHLSVVENLLKNGNYTKANKPAIYVYELQNGPNSHFGVWTMTDLKDLDRGDIRCHENTISENLERLTLYRREVGLEASPVLLTYPASREINSLIARAVTQQPTITYQAEDGSHRLWEVSDPKELAQYKKAFESIGPVYVADGHHRLAAASALSKTASGITSLYLASDQLSCSAFHRLVTPEKPISKTALLKLLSNYYYISAVPASTAYRPDKEGRLGLCHQGNWYQLDLKKTQTSPELQADVSFLQTMILAPYFGITDPGSDPWLSCWDNREWDKLLYCAEHTAGAIVFTLAPINAGKLIHLVNNRVVLPPKSTYISPKVPFGLLMHISSKGVAHA